MPTLRPVTIAFIESVFNGIDPSPAAKMAFGIASDDHLEALRSAVLSGRIDAGEVDATVSDGAKITELVNSVGCNPLGISFQAGWDQNSGRKREEDRAIESRENEQQYER